MPEGLGSQRAASVCRRPGAQHHVYAAERSVRGFCGRGADCVNARDPVRPNEVRSLRERAMERKAEGPRQSPRSACLPTARSSKFMFTRPCGASAGFAVAELAATPEDRQSERSEVSRDRATEKYRLPEGRAGRRTAVVRRVPEAGRRDSHQPRSGRVQAKRGRAGYGALTTYKAGGPRRSRCAARVRRWPGG